MGMDPDLDQCATIALRDMIKLLGEMTNLTKEDAYTLCSVAADLRVTQTVTTLSPAAIGARSAKCRHCS